MSQLCISDMAPVFTLSARNSTFNHELQLEPQAAQRISAGNVHRPCSSPAFATVLVCCVGQCEGFSPGGRGVVGRCGAIFVDGLVGSGW